MANRIVLNTVSYHGAGAVSEVGKELASRGFKKALVCCGKHIIKSGEINKILDPMTAEGVAHEIYNDIKPNLKSGNTLLVYDPDTHLSWNLSVYAPGRHCDSEPTTLRDTLIMFRSFGKPSWDIQIVYIFLPSGQWTMAAMHNHPHLTGGISANGFDGHLCVHFLRDMDECRKNDPDYGVNNQNALREAWKKLTGITVN